MYTAHACTRFQTRTLASQCEGMGREALFWPLFPSLRPGLSRSWLHFKDAPPTPPSLPTHRGKGGEDRRWKEACSVSLEIKTNPASSTAVRSHSKQSPRSTATEAKRLKTPKWAKGMFGGIFPQKNVASHFFFPSPLLLSATYIRPSYADRSAISRRPPSLVSRVSIPSQTHTTTTLAFP